MNWSQIFSLDLKHWADSKRRHHVQVRKLYFLVKVFWLWSQWPGFNSWWYIECVVCFFVWTRICCAIIWHMGIWNLDINSESFHFCRVCLIVCVSLIFDITAKPYKPWVCTDSSWLSTILHCEFYYFKSRQVIWQKMTNMFVWSLAYISDSSHVIFVLFFQNKLTDDTFQDTVM